jgi:hypothetical protein
MQQRSRFPRFKETSEKRRPDDRVQQSQKVADYVTYEGKPLCSENPI